MQFQNSFDLDDFLAYLFPGALFLGILLVGEQIAVFGRKGSRPLNRSEMQQLYLDDEGNPWYVKDE